MKAVRRFRRMISYFPRLLHIGGLAGVQVPDFRITPYITVSTFSIDRKIPNEKSKHGPIFRNDLDFDQRTISVKEFEEQDYRPRFFHEVLVRGMDLRETTEFAYWMHQIAQRGHARNGYKTEAQVLNYLEEKLRIYHSIRKAGRIRPTRTRFGRQGDQIGCMVDRRGNLVKGENGNNRFSIARMLGIQEIPVQIDFIHADLIPEIEKLEGRTPISKINRYLEILQDRHAPRVQGKEGLSRLKRVELRDLDTLEQSPDERSIRSQGHARPRR